MSRSERAGIEEAPPWELLRPREVPLGGLRAMTVRRTLPQRSRPVIGPWCFVDHFGPDDVAATGGMAVPRHPHTGLATVTLLFEGQIDHLDSTGFANTVRPGEVNLMIAGRGVSHSEFSTPDTTRLHGVQLWYALPESLRHGRPQSQHHRADAVGAGDGQVRTYLGALLITGGGAGASSPVDTRTPAVAAEITIPPRGTVTLDLDPQAEHGLLLDIGGRVDIEASGSTAVVTGGDLLHLPISTPRVRLSARDAAARLVLIGGPPLQEDLVMWWNFVGRSHDEIATFRQEWQRALGGDNATGFGAFPADTPPAIPAPRLPEITLKPRRTPGRS